jgi:putative nucleotidyltransferase with HDIG domain
MALRIRDPIHNFVVLPDDLEPLLNTKVLQRLRRIRQLAMADLVYPGALHTRFDHTLGVTHVAGQMAEQLKIAGEDLRLVQLAALLHDIGHGPFSHVSEASLGRFADRDTLRADQKGEKIHELVTENIIEKHEELHRAIGAYPVENIVNLLGKGTDRRILKQVVSGPLDADKQDYLLRDSRFCGVQYGMFDLHQMQRSLVTVGNYGEEELMIAQDGVHAVEQFVLAKYYMTANVYRHRVRLITDAMIGRAIKLGIELDRLEQMERLYRFNNTDQFIINYLQWDDFRFLETFCPLNESPPGAKSGAMLRRLRERELLKQVYSEKIETFDARVRETAQALPKPEKDAIRTEIEQKVAAFLARELGVAVDPDFVIVHAYDIKSARETSSNDEEEILVNHHPSPRAFIEESSLFKSINAAYTDKCVEVYAPVAWTNRDKRDELRGAWKEPIRGIITDGCLAGRRTRT